MKNPNHKQNQGAVIVGSSAVLGVIIQVVLHPLKSAKVLLLIMDHGLKVLRDNAQSSSLDLNESNLQPKRMNYCPLSWNPCAIEQQLIQVNLPSQEQSEAVPASGDAILRYLLHQSYKQKRVAMTPNDPKLSHGANNRKRGFASKYKTMEQPPLAPARCLAHWTFTQRTIHVVLAIKAAVLRNEKQIPIGPTGNAISAARQQAGLTQEKLAEISGIHRQWIGRWERGRALPSSMEWASLGAILQLPSQPASG